MKPITVKEVVREAIIILAGSILAAWVIGMLPPLKQWLAAAFS